MSKILLFLTILNKKTMKNIFLFLMSVLVLSSCNLRKGTEDVVNVYTKRHYQVDKDLFAQFEKIYNIKVNVVKASADELIERIKTEADNCPADLLITVDAGKLYKASSQNLLQKINYSDFPNSIGKKFLDKNGYWLPITYRARLIVYHKDRVNENELSTYSSLVDPKWKGKILVRSSKNAYNQALLSSMIANLGEAKALNWSNKIVENFSREPKGNDRDQVRAIAAGVGDIAIVNSYYIGLLKSSVDSNDRVVGETVNVFFPNQSTSGTHINISGIGLLRNSPNTKNAKLLMKFLVSDYAQSYYTNNSYEYPVNSNVKPSDLIASWGSFVIDSLDLNLLGVNRKRAVEIFERSDWK